MDTRFLRNYFDMFCGSTEVSICKHRRRLRIRVSQRNSPTCIRLRRLVVIVIVELKNHLLERMKGIKRNLEF